MSSVTDATKSSGRARRWPGAIGRSSEIRILAVALILAAYFEIANHDFLLTSASLENLSQFIAPVAIIACGEIMLMIGGEIDLSAGMVFAFAPFIMHFAHEAGVPTWIALIVGVAAAGVVGLDQRRGNGVSAHSLVRHHARHAVPHQRPHADHLARHAGDPRRKAMISPRSWAPGAIARSSGRSAIALVMHVLCATRAGACIRSPPARIR